MYLALALSMLVVFGFTYFQQPEEPSVNDKEVEEVVEEDPGVEEPAVETEPEPEEAEEEEPLPAEEVELAQVEESGETIPFKTDYHRGHFNLRGAELGEIKLPDHPMLGEKDRLFNFVAADGGGLRLENAFPQLSLSQQSFNLLESEDEDQFIFQKELENGLLLRKRYDLLSDRGYEMELSVELVNQGEEEVELSGLDFPAGGPAGRGGLGLRWGPNFGPDRLEETRFDRDYVHYGDGESSSYFSAEGAGIWDRFTGDEDDQRYEFSRGPIDWMSVSNRYFIAAMIPENSFNMIFLNRGSEAEDSYSAWAGYRDFSLNPGDKRQENFTLYLGPKHYEVLQELAPGLEAAQNYGWFTFLSLPLLWGLNAVYSVIPNYGLAIIIISLLVKTILYPLTKKSLTSMQKMKKLQPRMKELQDKYDDDKEKLNQKMMELYQEEGVNPLGGCLPMLLQMPIFFALYRTLQYSIELRGAHFLFWIADLSSRDPYYILPIAMGLAMFVQQSYQMASGGGGQQKAMAYIMPVVFVFIFMNLPAGLVIYFLTNSLATLGQYWLINRSMEG